MKIVENQSIPTDYDQMKDVEMRVDLIVNNVHFKDSSYTNEAKTFENNLTISEHKNQSIKAVNNS